MNLKYVIAGLLLVSTVFSLTVNIPNQFQTVQEGQVPSYDVIISNTGSPVNVLVTTDSKLPVSVSEPLFHLGTNESKTIKVFVITKGAGEGVYAISLDVNGQEYEVGVNVKEQSPVLSFTPVYSDLTVVQGQYQDLRFILRNNGKERIRNIVIEGNLPESFKPEYPAPIDLAGNEVKEVRVRIHVPSDYPVDDYEYSVKAGAGNQITTAPVYLKVDGLASVKDRLSVKVLLPWESIKDEGKTVGYKLTFRVRNRQIYDINDVNWVFTNLPEDWKVVGNDSFSVKGYETKDIELKVYPTSFNEQEVNVSFVKGDETITTQKIVFSGSKIGFSGTGLVIGGGSSSFWGVIFLIAIIGALFYVRNQNELREKQEEEETTEYLKKLVEKTVNGKKKRK